MQSTGYGLRLDVLCLDNDDLKEKSDLAGNCAYWLIAISSTAVMTGSRASAEARVIQVFVRSGLQHNQSGADDVQA